MEFSGKKSQENGPLAEKNDNTERAKGLGRKNKRGDRKGESNDSPKIPDRRVTSDIPGLPWGESQLSSDLDTVSVTYHLV